MKINFASKAIEVTKTYVVQNQITIKQIRTKAMRYLSLVKRGILKSPLNILETKKKLMEK